MYPCVPMCVKYCFLLQAKHVHDGQGLVLVIFYNRKNGTGLYTDDEHISLPTFIFFVNNSKIKILFFNLFLFLSNKGFLLFYHCFLINSCIGL